MDDDVELDNMSSMIYNDLVEDSFTTEETEEKINYKEISDKYNDIFRCIEKDQEKLILVLIF